uniref:transposase n=1 Tax=Acidaminococcus timonensis TaxID=1871002 RepID=UPI0029430ECE
HMAHFFEIIFLHHYMDITVEEFKSVIKTFTDWKTEILEGLSQAYSNGFTEGMNNKIKVLKRVAFGFRNFERFRSRILLLSMVKLK